MSTASQEIDVMFAKIPDWRGETLARLRALIHEADPEMVETVKWRRPSNPDGAPVFEHDGIVCILGALKGRVRLGIEKGAHIDDPQGLYNAMLVGHETRAIDFYEHDVLNEDGIKDLVRAAVALNVARSEAKGSR